MLVLRSRRGRYVPMPVFNWLMAATCETFAVMLFFVIRSVTYDAALPVLAKVGLITFFVVLALAVSTAALCFVIAGIEDRQELIERRDRARDQFGTPPRE